MPSFLTQTLCLEEKIVEDECRRRWDELPSEEKGFELELVKLSPQYKRVLLSGVLLDTARLFPVEQAERHIKENYYDDLRFGSRKVFYTLTGR